MDKPQLHAIYPAEDNIDGWETADDRVMGGISVAQLSERVVEQSRCRCLSGEVSLENRGGFVQMKWPMPSPFDASGFSGIYIEAWGNNESYNVHVRTGQLWLPWQSFRLSFIATSEWQTHYFSFNQFANYKTWSQLDASGITKIAIVAIGRAFQADVCVRALGFYRS
jgi:hypothetical protein